MKQKGVKILIFKNLRMTGYGQNIVKMISGVPRSKTYHLRDSVI